MRAIRVCARVERCGYIAGRGFGFPAEAHFDAGPHGGLEAWVDDFGWGRHGAGKLLGGKGRGDCWRGFGAVHGF